MSYKGCYFHAEAQQTVLAYPSFTISSIIANEIELWIQPSDTTAPHFDKSIATYVSPKYNLTTVKSSLQHTNKQHSLTMLPNNIDQYIPDQSRQSSSKQHVQIKRLVPHATILSCSSPGSIRYGVTSIDTLLIPPRTTCTIPLGLSTSFSPNMYMCIASRSSLVLQQITVQGGVIDSNYRGENKVILHNASDTPYQVESGQ